MKPYHWAFIGLTLDIIGAFLLAVEAIKIDNLRKLKVKFLIPVHRATLSPKITWVDGKMTSAVSKKFMLFYNGLHYLAGFLLLLAINYLLDGLLLTWTLILRDWLFERPWYVILLSLLIILIVGVFAGLWMLGELVHMAITKISRLSVHIVTYINSNTPSGTTGIIGFVLMLLGFLFQMLSAYLGGNISSVN